MSVVVGNILRVACRQEYIGTDDNINVYHFGVEAVPTPNDDAALLADISVKMSNVYSQIASHLSGGLDAVDITVYNLSQDVPHGVTAWGPTYTGGTASGESMPPADCLLLLFPTSVKRTIGRIYLSPLSEGDQSAGIWNSTVRVAAEDFAAELRDTAAGPNGLALAYGVYKRSNGLLYEPASYRSVARTAYQRRRKPGRGS